MIKLYYNKTTTQFISYDDGGMPIIQGDDGQKEFHIYFDDPSVIGAYNCRVVIERPDGAKSNEIYATPITGVLGGYYKVVVSSWVAEVEGVLKITTRLKTINNEPIVFGVANIPVQFGVDPDENETITDTQYEAIQNAVDGIINGQTPLSFDQLNLYSGSCSLDFDNKFDCESNSGIWTYADALTFRYNGKDPVLSYRGIEGELFKNLFEEAEPASGVTFTNGMPIMYAGSVGASGKVFAKPTNLNELRDNPQLFLGIVTEVTTEGHAIFNWYGTVSNINTIGKTLGETLYVGNGVLLTHANKPISPLPLIPIGIVERVHAFGKISVRPDIGRSLGQLHNVYVNGNEVDGITIVYNDETSRYEAYDLKGNIFRIDTEIGNIKNGTTIVEKAKRDKNGNDIVETYETKADITSKLEFKANITYVDSKDAILQSQINGNVLDIESLEMGKEDKSMKGQPNGYAPLDVSGYIPSAFVPNSFDDVIEFNTYADLLAYSMPQSNKLFIVKQDETSGGNHSTYRWASTMYIRVTDEMSAAEVKVLYESNADTNPLTDVLKNNYDTAYNHSQVFDLNPHKTKYAQLEDKPTTVEELGVTNVYTKPETYTQQEINALLDNLSAVKGVKSTLLTPTELSNGDAIATNLLTDNGAYVIFTATNVANNEIDSDTVPVSTIVTGKNFVFFDNQEIVFTIGETNSTFETSEDITLKINLLYLDNENVKAVGVEFDGSLTNYLLSQTNVQEALEKIDEELKQTQTDLESKYNFINFFEGMVDFNIDTDCNERTIYINVSNSGFGAYPSGYSDGGFLIQTWEGGGNERKAQMLFDPYGGKTYSRGQGEEDVWGEWKDHYGDNVALKVNISDIVNNLTSTDIDKPLSAKQGKVLQDTVDLLDNNKVPKTTTIIGLDLQDNILIGEFRTALGNATQSVAGLLSPEDKTHYDSLVALLETSDGNNVVDTIGEILAIFQNYPEGADLVTALAGKVDKVAGKGLSTNDLTNTLKTNYDTAYTHSQSTHAPSNAQKNSDITKTEIEAKLTGEIASHSHALPTHTHTKSQITDFPTSMPPTAHSTDLLTSGTLGIARGGTGRTDGYAVGIVETRASVLTKIWTGTQAQYDAIGTKDANTLYFII